MIDDIAIEIQKIHAVYIHNGAEIKGSFECSDELLNKIWSVGAFTVHLNTQNYIFDGIKRDRLVWIGDMHPEISTLLATYGFNEALTRSLDFIRNCTPADKWMNGIATYSMWWIIIHYDLYMHCGDFNYLSEQRSYLKCLVHHAIDFARGGFVSKGSDSFVDWSSVGTENELDGVKSVVCIGLKYAAKLLDILGEKQIAKECMSCSMEISADKPKAELSKCLAALSVLAKRNTDFENDKISGNSAKGISCFMGYYILLAKAELGESAEALDIIRSFWGGMINMGATTFWEDFDIEWMDNSFRIDEMPREGMTDIHGDFGKYCYKQFRHSLCHGWASGPTAFLSQHIMGLEILEPGCKRIRIKPDLCGLSWAKIKYPTPYGLIEVEIIKGKDELIEKKINAPSDIVIEM